MADRDEIIAFCDQLLEIERFTDYGPNGLQVPGAREVTKLVSGVSAQRELIERAASGGAELVIAHHGLFWDFHPRALSEQMATRLKRALAADLSVAGYHLPLDAHPEIGNNALLARGLGLEPDGTVFAAVKGAPIGVIGRSAEGVDAAELFAAVAELVGREPLVFDAGPSRIHSVGIVSGAAASSIHEAIALGLDAFLTGEPAEHVMADAREGQIHFLAAGHYATEVFGIRRLGELVSERFAIDHEFIEIPNPV